MLIEGCAYANRWRKVSPAAKTAFAACGLGAAWLAKQPASAVIVCSLLVAVTLLGAGVSPRRFLRVALPALFFLVLGSCSLAFSLNLGAASGDLRVELSPVALRQVGEVGARSLGALAALLFLALTTPLVDLIAGCRRLRMPEVLLDIMVLCYRMLFVFSSAVHDTTTAQSARLGYATPRLSIRSLGELTANLTLQVWQRARALELAAQARNNDGPLRFLEPVFVNTRRDCVIALLAGTCLIILARGLP